MNMARRIPIPVSLVVCLLLAACNSGPSSSGRSTGADEAALRERKAEYIEGVIARRGQAGQALEALVSALPDRVWLTEVALDAGKIRAKGRAATNNLLADYVTRLGENASFTNVTLGGSVMKSVRGRETQEFSFEIALMGPGPGTAGTGGPAAELPPRQDSGAILRKLQGLARDSGLQLTKFAGGAEVAREFAAEVPVTIEVAGNVRPLASFLDGLAHLEGLWVVERFTLRAAAPDDPRTPVRAAVSTRAFFAR
jgi:hypothetical protein